MSDERELDVIVFGATGFVGRLTAAHLAEHAPDGVRVGLGGRSAAKLQEVRASLPARAADWPLVVADSMDAGQMQAMAARTTVVASTVGPYLQYGMALVQACAAAGTHYADLTGEVLFMRASIDRADEAAQASGARIVHACGFDSIPSDLGVHLLHRAAGDEPLTEATLVVMGAKGGFSGGTLASLMGQLDEGKRDKVSRAILMDPYALSPDREAEPDLGAQSDVRPVARDAALGVWVAPFVMASVNTRVVRRSNALLGHAYGHGLRYREVMSVGGGPLGPVKAAAVSGALGAAIGGMLLPPTRALMNRVLPSPGEGPSEETQRKGFYKIRLHGRTASGRSVGARVEAQGDPGYAATAVLLGQSALCLAFDGDRLPERAGVLTPATAMGDALVDRLVAAGQTLQTT